MIHEQTPSRSVRITAFIICALLVLFAAVRAWTLAITHDEAYTYNYFIHEPLKRILATTEINANNHILNTLCCQVINGIFGNHIFLMRLYVVAFLVMYLRYAYRLLALTGNNSIILCGLVFVGANPFILDFFSLIRGYGGGLACLMAALYYTARYFRGDEKEMRWLWAAMIFAGLTPFFHLSFFNIFLPFTGMLWVCSMAIAWKKNRENFWRSALYRSIPILLIGLLVSQHTIRKAFYLKGIGDIDFGGVTGLWADVAFSLLYYSSWGKQYGMGEWWNLPVIKYLIIGLFFVAGIVFIVAAIRGSRKNGPGLFTSIPIFIWMITALLLLSIELQFILLKTTYPNGRLVIFLVPLYALILLYLGWYALRLHKALAALPIALASMFTVHIIASANFTHTLYWTFDADTPAMLDDLRQITKDKPEPVNLGTEWLIEPAGNYYRKRYHWEKWLPEFNREGLKPDQEYFYCHRNTPLPVSHYQEIKYYPVSEFRLLRNLEYHAAR